jgi:hypothetical protein
MKRFCLIITTVLMALGVSVMSAYATLAIDFTVNPGFNYHDANSYSMGWEFDVNQPIIVTSLGFYDYQQDGLAESHAVGIYNASGDLLVSGTVNPGDPLTGWFRFHSVTPTLLPAGDAYFIAAVTGNEDFCYNQKGIQEGPEIAFIIARIYYDYPYSTDTLLFPVNANHIDSPAYFGPNFQYVNDPPPSHAPVPATLLLLGSGLLGLGGLRKKFKK